MMLVWRQEQISCFRQIDAQEAQAILLARTGMRFAGLCAALVDLRGEKEGVLLASQFLGRWLADGLLTNIIEIEGEGS